MTESDLNAKLQLCVWGSMVNLFAMGLLFLGYSFALERMSLWTLAWSAGLIIAYVVGVGALVTSRLPTERKFSFRKDMWVFEMVELPGAGFFFLLLFLWLVR